MKDSRTKIVVYLEERIDKLFKICPEYFNNESINSLEVLAKDKSIDFKNFSDKIFFSAEDSFTFHAIDFLKEYSTLWFIKNLASGKINIDN